MAIHLDDFTRASYDGYCVRSADTALASDLSPCYLSVVAESFSGCDDNLYVGGGETIRIFAGAPIPIGSDAVIKREDVSDVYPDITRIKIVRPCLSGQGLALPGCDIKKGTYLASSGK